MKISCTRTGVFMYLTAQDVEAFVGYIPRNEIINLTLTIARAGGPPVTITAKVGAAPGHGRRRMMSVTTITVIRQLVPSKTSQEFPYNVTFSFPNSVLEERRSLPAGQLPASFHLWEADVIITRGEFLITLPTAEGEDIFNIMRGHNPPVWGHNPPVVSSGVMKQTLPPEPLRPVAVCNDHEVLRKALRRINDAIAEGRVEASMSSEGRVVLTVVSRIEL